MSTSRSISRIAPATSAPSRPAELWSRLDDAHAAAEAAIGLCEFQSDIAAADDDQMVGKSIELERPDIGERVCRRKAGNIRNRRMRPEIESHAIAGQHARAAA